MIRRRVKLRKAFLPWRRYDPVESQRHQNRKEHEHQCIHSDEHHRIEFKQRDTGGVGAGQVVFHFPVHCENNQDELGTAANPQGREGQTPAAQTGDSQANKHTTEKPQPYHGDETTPSIFNGTSTTNATNARTASGSNNMEAFRSIKRRSSRPSQYASSRRLFASRAITCGAIIISKKRRQPITGTSTRRVSGPECTTAMTTESVESDRGRSDGRK